MKLNKQFYLTAWQNLRRHYIMNIVVAFLVGFLVKDGYHYTSDWMASEVGTVKTYMLTEDKKTNFEILEEFVEEQEVVDVETPEAKTAAEKYTMGYFSVIVNEVTSSGSLGFGVLNGINKILFHGKIGESVVIFVMVIISALGWIFWKNLLLVGRCRYYMEERLYPYTKADRILFVYRTRHIGNVAKIMLVRSVRLALWNLTIVGGVIKYYEYLMIPYVLAENPTITTKEAFVLSKQLMQGDKRNAFLLDLTMMPVTLLDYAVFHLISFFCLNAYRECLYSEFYTGLREAKRSSLTGAELLYDVYLAQGAKASVYPDEHCPTPYLAHREWLVTDYDRDYGGNTPILLFFFLSIFGWTWEVFFYLINDGSFINRGTMTGPWLPIYGVGGWIVIYGLKGLRKNPAVMFVGSVLACGVLEYFASWLLELLMHKRWWDYTGYFMNLNGRICLEGLLLFGTIGVTMTYFVAPIVDKLLLKIPGNIRKILCFVLVALFAADFIWSVGHPNVGNGITEGFY
ncbi:MAG: DUF975 family protein [Lachnospiraceae bacterium]|nr:DUF975 family protein [Lachnospiraceae bacterium]